jgi:hypothetical protein
MATDILGISIERLVQCAWDHLAWRFAVWSEGTLFLKLAFQPPQPPRDISMILLRRGSV